MRAPVKKRISNVVDTKESGPPAMAEDEELQGQSVDGSAPDARFSARKKKIMKPKGLKAARADAWDS